MNRFLFPALALCALAFLTWSCLPDPLEGDTDLQSVEDHAFAESEFQEIQAVFEAEARQTDLVKKTEGYFCSCSGADLVANPNGTYTMTIDYGAGCTCLDGRTRTGKLIGVFSGKWQPGTTLTITPENYTVTGLNNVTYQFSFTKTVSLKTANAAGNPVVEVSVNNAVLTAPAGQIRWNADWVTEWISGLGDIDPSNNVYTVTGNAAGTDIEGLNFTVEIVTPLRVEGSCPNVVSGVLKLTPDGRQVRTIDYGNGACDREAVISIGSFSRTILLR